MDGNQEIMYINRAATQCPNCFGELDGKEKKRGTFFCLYCGQKLVVGNDPAKPAPQPQPAAPQPQPAAPQPQPAAPQPQPAAPQPQPAAPQPQPVAPQPQPVGQGMPAGGMSNSQQRYGEYYGSPATPVQKQPVYKEKKTGVYGILSVVFGAVSALTCCCYGSGILFGAVSIVFGVLGIKKNKSRDINPGALNVIGLILGIFGTVLSLIMTIWIIVASVTGGSTPMNTIQNTTGTQTTWGAGTPSNVKENSTTGSQEKKEEKKSETVKQDAKSEEAKSEEAKTQESEVTKEETQPEEEKPEEAKAEEAESVETEEKADTGDISAEFKDAMDAYEACVDEYVSLMKKMQADPTNMELMADYMDYLAKIEDMEEKMTAWEGNMNAAEEAYYTKVMLRCSEKMMNAAY